MKNIKQYLYDFERFGLTPSKLLAQAMGQKKNAPRILTVTLPKSGTNLLQRMLILHPSLSRAWLPTLGRRNHKLWADIRKLLGGVGSGKIISSHLDYNDDLADLVQKELQYKVLLMARDPRDVVVSEIYYIQTWPGHPHKQLVTTMKNDKERLLAVIKGYGVIPPINKQILRFSGWADRAFVVRFEDAVGAGGGGNDESQREVVRGIYGYLGMSISDSQLDYICKNARSAKTQNFRRGAIGDWKNKFDSEVAAEFKKQAGKLLIDLGYEKDLDW